MASKLFAAVRRSPRLRPLLFPPSPSPSPSPSSSPAVASPFLLLPSGARGLGSPPPHFSFPGSHHKFFFAGMASQRSFATSVEPEKKEPSGIESGKKDKLPTTSFQTFMSSVATAPVLPMVLGIAGAVPFLALTPPIPYFLPLPDALSVNPIEAQSMYGAAILSFLGGPHWGLAMVGVHASPNHKIFNYASNTLRYVWSVVPCLVSWAALLMVTVPRLQLLICSFGVVFVVDVFFASQGLLPPWYLPLRLLLTGIVVLCLSASLIELLITKKLEAEKTQKKQ